MPGLLGLSHHCWERSLGCFIMAFFSRWVFIGRISRISRISRSFFAKPAFAFEEIGEDLAAVAGQHSADDFATMVEPWIVEELIQ